MARKMADCSSFGLCTCAQAVFSVLREEKFLYMPEFSAIIFTGINFLTGPFGRSVRTELLSILTSFQKLYAESIYPKDTYRPAGATERKRGSCPHRRHMKYAGKEGAVCQMR